MTDFRSFLCKYPIDYIFQAEQNLKKIHTTFQNAIIDIFRTKLLFINTILISRRNLCIVK